MSDFGRLLINVYGLSMGIPLEGALIRIINTDNNSVLAETVTDNSGKSDILNLTCPPREYSLEYGADIPKPYAHHLEVMREGFTPQRILGVEILGGTTAIQNIALLPHDDQNNQTQTIVINEHSLYAEYPSKIYQA